MPDIICKWEILLTSLSILKSCFYSLLFLSLVLILFQKKKILGLGADYLLEFCNRVLLV